MSGSPGGVESKLRHDSLNYSILPIIDGNYMKTAPKVLQQSHGL